MEYGGIAAHYAKLSAKQGEVVISHISDYVASDLIIYLIKNGSYSEIEQYDDIYRRCKINGATVHNAFGISLYRQGRYAESADRFSLSIALDSKNATYFINRASAKYYINGIDALDDYLAAKLIGYDFSSNEIEFMRYAHSHWLSFKKGASAVTQESIIDEIRSALGISGRLGHQKWSELFSKALAELTQ
jgi:tetratricopeptide (TPR) repeat protein